MQHIMNDFNRHTGILAAMAMVVWACGSTSSTSSTETLEKPRSWSAIQGGSADDRDAPDPIIRSLLVESRFHFESRGAYQLERIHKYKILKEEALEEWSMVSVSWTPWHEEKPIIKATVFNPDGTRAELDPKTISDQSAREISDQIISGNRQMIAPLPKLQVGSIVEVVTRETYRESVYGPAASGWHAFGAVGRDVDESRLIIDHPKEISLRFRNYEVSAKVKTSEVGNRVIETAEMRSIAPIRYPEANLPREMVVIPYIAFSSGESWKSLADAYLAQIAPVMNIDECRAEVHALMSREGSREQRMAHLLNEMRKKVRYTGLELGENAIVPVSPCETLRRGFGDCKDQAALMVAGLKEMGVKSHLALVKSDYDIDIEPTLPSLYGFNHVIVYVPGETPEWIDPSLEYARVSEIAASYADTNALIIAPGTTQLQRTPKAATADNSYAEKRTFDLAIYGAGSVTEESTYSGGIERFQRRNAFNSESTKINEYFTNYVEQAYGAEQLESVHQIDPRNLDEHFGYRVVASRAKSAQTDLEAAVATLAPWALFDFVSRSLDPRKYDKGDLEEKRIAPMQIFDVCDTSIEYIVNAPEGFSYRGDLKDFSEQVGPVTFGVTYTAPSSTQVTAKFYLSTGDGQLTKTEVDEVRSALLRWTEKFPVNVRFHNITYHHMETGKFKRGLTYVQQLIEKSPTVPEYHLWYAAALLSSGFGEAAQEAARKATRLAPNSVHAWVNLGWTLEHNFVARRFGKGFNRQAAIRAYEKAVRLDNRNTYAVSSLAILLEHNGKGQRYTNTNDVNRAISLYRTILEDQESGTIKNNLLAALVWTGQFNKVLEETDENPETLDPANYRVTAIAAVHGADEAITQSKIIFPDEEQRGSALEDAVFHLVRNRQYTEAARLLRAMDSGVGGTDRLVRAAMLEKIKKTPETITFAETPEKPIKEMLAIFLGKTASMKALYAPSLQPFLSDEDSGDVQDVIETFHQALGSNEELYSMDFYRDMFYSLMAFSKKGDDKVGYKLEVKQLGYHKLGLSFLVVKEKGRYYLADAAQIGMSAMLIQQMLDDKKQKTAERWLDWALETNTISDLHEYWSPGSNGDLISAQIAVWRIMIVFRETVQFAIPRIEEALRNGEMKSHEEKLRKILLSAYASVNDNEKIMSLAQKMIDANQQFNKAWAYYQYAGYKARKYKEVQTLARALLQRNPDNEGLRDTVDSLLYTTGEYDAYWRVMTQKKAESSLSDVQYNNMAWLTLFSFGTIRDGIEYALKSVELSKGEDADTMHTLAALYAEEGKVSESYHLLSRILNIRKDKSPRSEDWYIIGRLAEHLNLKTTAASAYCHVEKSEGGEEADTWHLAQKRMRQMKTGKCKTAP